MADDDVLGTIDSLIGEEHQLRSAAQGGGLTEQQRARLGDVEVRLDQCWDLLRQRRARAEFGEERGEAAPRPASQVESYEQ